MTLLTTEMATNQEFCTKYFIWYSITQNSSMVKIKKISWFFALLLNLVIILTYKLGDAIDDEEKGNRKLEEPSF